MPKHKESKLGPIGMILLLGIVAYFVYDYYINRKENDDWNDAAKDFLSYSEVVEKV